MPDNRENPMRALALLAGMLIPAIPALAGMEIGPAGTTSRLITCTN